MKISAKIIVFNEESNIAEACRSVDWADELVIVDSFSTDRTVEIAREFTDKVFFNRFENFRQQHIFADSKTSHDWVFWLDADERLSPELRQSILKLQELGEDVLPSAYRFSRRAQYFGRWIKHSGWYPNRVLRLYRKSASNWRDNPVHEGVTIEGDIGTLEGDLLHYTYNSLRDQHEVVAKYAALAADFRFEQGERAGWWSVLVRPPIAFIESYFLKLGFLDGLHGLFIAYFRAYGVFLRSALIWEHRHREDDFPEPSEEGPDAQRQVETKEIISE
ncbi:MAG: glycosyltransferase family 2 protein [Acidobacteria bacterium]|nr:MAG: glycosyltransferase family 2 protein [Acidobacteriota bacterium]REK04119.1 MAG: glycosyltransferase family 2 protein [Acidobacteriota bacterium]REK15281.1 MAG: glycosyltransferase family 2 protein [Acidobacteriota bacterium]REK46371.1 MAG: glycosyltransferase family 2 protein [Acidobacteriota bacterium]